MRLTAVFMAQQQSHSGVISLALRDETSVVNLATASQLCFYHVNHDSSSHIPIQLKKRHVHARGDEYFCARFSVHLESNIE